MQTGEDVEINKPEKNKGGRPKKDNKYVLERKQVLTKLLKILNINDQNKIFYFNDVDADPVKQKQILDLKPYVHKYFICGRWSIFAKKNIDRPYISLIRSLLKATEQQTKFISLRNSQTHLVEKQGLIFV